jgi:mRNA interferase RelE/StbE
MKTVRYLKPALRDLGRHQEMAVRLRKALAEYAANPKAHSNNVKSWDGNTRLRVGKYRIVFVETEAEILVTKIGPRGEVYEN